MLLWATRIKKPDAIILSEGLGGADTNDDLRGAHQPAFGYSADCIALDKIRGVLFWRKWPSSLKSLILKCTEAYLIKSRTQ